MVTQQLLDYIKAQQQNGKSKEQITQELIKGGWQAQDVEQGFVSLSTGAMPVPPTFSAKLPNPIELFKEAWKTYKQRFWTLVGISLVPFVFISIQMLFINNDPNGKTALNHLNFPGSPVVFFLIVIASLIFSIWAEAALITNLNNQENQGFLFSFSNSKNKIWTLFVVGILTGLAVVGGIFLLIIPGIIFGLWFSQASYIVITENQGIIGSMKLSKSYVKGRLGAVFWRLLVIAIFSILVSILVSFIVNSLALVVDNNIRSLASSLISVLWSPLVAIYCFKLYKNLKI